MTDEGKRHSSRTVEGRTELDLVQDEVDEAKRLLEEANVEVQAAQNIVTEAAFRVGQAMEEMAQIRKLLEANSDPAGQFRTGQKKRLLGCIKKTKATGQKKRLLGCIKKTKAMWERWYEAILEEEKLQSSKDIVRPRRPKCMQFYSTLLPTCEEEPSCYIQVFWWQRLITKKIHT